MLHVGANNSIVQNVTANSKKALKIPRRLKHLLDIIIMGAGEGRRYPPLQVPCQLYGTILAKQELYQVSNISWHGSCSSLVGTGLAVLLLGCVGDALQLGCVWDALQLGCVWDARIAGMICARAPLL